MSAPTRPLADDLRVFVERLAEELEYNDGKGAYPYGQGMHDGLKFAYDSLLVMLREHGLVESAGPLETRLASRRSDEDLRNQLLGT